jgi:hypothetical protein
MAHSNNHRQHYFAPGAIEHHVFSRAHQRRALMRWLKRAALFMAAVAWGLLVFTAVASPAHAQTPSAEARHPLAPSFIGLHIGSYHFSAAPAGHRAWNDTNPGVYARWSNGLTVGTLYNSERRQSAYAAWTWETERWHGLTAAVTAGAITGYAATVSPLLSLSGSVALSQRTALRLSLLPKAHPQASAVAHLSAEWRF